MSNFNALTPVQAEIAAAQANLPYDDRYCMGRLIVAEVFGSPQPPTLESVRQEIAATTVIELAAAEESPDIWSMEALPNQAIGQIFQGTPAEIKGYRLSEEKLSIKDPRITLTPELQQPFLERGRQKAIGEFTRRATESFWWTSERTGIPKDLADGRLTEYVRIDKGGQGVDVLNFDRPMTPQEKDDLAKVVKQMTNASRGAVFDKLKTIVLQYQDRFTSSSDIMTDGTAYHEWGLIRLNTAARDTPPSPAETLATPVPGWTYFQSNVAHEISHLLMPAPPAISHEDDATWAKLSELDGYTAPGRFDLAQWSFFGAQLPAATRQHSDPRCGTNYTVSSVAPANEMWVLDGGTSRKVNPYEHFTAEEIASDRPLTPYSHRSVREDETESLKFYALGGPGSVGALRRALVNHRLAELAAATSKPDRPALWSVATKAVTDIQFSYPVPTRGSFGVYLYPMG